MGQTYSKRMLAPVGAIQIHVYGNAAVAQLKWDFVATLRGTDKSIHHTGRESEVFISLPGKGWRLVHVHYSGPAR